MGQSNIKVRTLRSLADLEGYRSYWEKWQASSNTDYAYFQLVCRIRPEVESPLVTVCERNGEPCALLIGRLESTHFQPRVGYLNSLRVRARILRILHQGFLGQIDEEVATAVVLHLHALLNAQTADVAAFHGLAENSLLWRAITSHIPLWLCERQPLWVKHWAMTLASDPGFILQRLKSKHRSWIKKKDKELEADFATRVHWQWIMRFEDLPTLCARIEAVAALTYQRGLGAGFVNDNDHLQRLGLFAERGQLRAMLLKIDGKVRAFWLGVVSGSTFDSWATGYDPELRSYEVGTLMFIRMVDELVGEGIRRLDFGFGEAFYKERFGDESWNEATVHIFAQSVKGGSLRFSLACAGVVDRISRQVLQKAGAIDRVKTYWRRKLSAGDKRPAAQQ